MRVRVWEVSGPQLHRWTWAKHSVCLETQCFSMEYSLLPSEIVLGVGKEKQRCHCPLGKPWRGETDHLNVMVGWWLVIFYHAKMCSAPICTHISGDISSDLYRPQSQDEIVEFSFFVALSYESNLQLGCF